MDSFSLLLATHLYLSGIELQEIWSAGHFYFDGAMLFNFYLKLMGISDYLTNHRDIMHGIIKLRVV